MQNHGRHLTPPKGAQCKSCLPHPAQTFRCIEITPSNQPLFPEGKSTVLKPAYKQLICMQTSARLAGMKPKRIAVYGRVSTGAQNHASQLREVRGYVRRRWPRAEVVEYLDKASGARFST